MFISHKSTNVIEKHVLLTQIENDIE